MPLDFPESYLPDVLETVAMHVQTATPETEARKGLVMARHRASGGFSGRVPFGDRTAGNVLHDVFLTPPEWMNHAACRGTDPEAYFPEKGQSTADAKKVCSGCPVRAECLLDALDRRDAWGIWGGLSVNERRRLDRSGAA